MARVLVIEDDSDIRSNLFELIGLFGHEVQAAENGVEGIEKVGSFLPELIICDIRMPEKNGYQVKKFLNENEKFNEIPFVFLTAMTSIDELTTQSGLGKFNYLIKPYQISDIDDLLKSLDQ